MAVLPGSLWVAQHRTSTVAKIDPATNRVVATVDIAQGADQPARFAVGSDGNLWEADYSGSGVVEIDPTANKVLQRFAAPAENCCQPAFAAGALWVVNPDPPAALVRIDARDGHATSYRIAGLTGGVTSAAGSLWATAAGDLVRINPATGAVAARVKAGLSADCCGDGGTLAAGALWLVDGSRMRRIDPSTNQVAATITLPRQGCASAGNDTALFVVSCTGGTLWRIDPAANKLLGKLDLGGYGGAVGDVKVGFGSVWVSMFDANEVVRVVPR